MKDGVSIIRKVDDIGRVLIPKDICHRFGWLPGTSLEMLVGDDCIVYRRYKHYARVADVIKELKDLVACDEEVDWRDRAEINNLLKEIERILGKGNE